MKDREKLEGLGQILLGFLFCPPSFLEETDLSLSPRAGAQRCPGASWLGCAELNLVSVWWQLPVRWFLARAQPPVLSGSSERLGSRRWEERQPAEFCPHACVRGGIKVHWPKGVGATGLGSASWWQGSALAPRHCWGVDGVRIAPGMSPPAAPCPLSELPADFCFPPPEKKSGKEKKSKKGSAEGELAADGSAEVQKKKKKKVGATPGVGCHGGEPFWGVLVALVPAAREAGEEQSCVLAFHRYRGGCS